LEEARCAYLPKAHEGNSSVSRIPSSTLTRAQHCSPPCWGATEGFQGGCCTQTAASTTGYGWGELAIRLIFLGPLRDVDGWPIAQSDSGFEKFGSNDFELSKPGGETALDPVVLLHQVGTGESDPALPGIHVAGRRDDFLHKPVKLAPNCAGRVHFPCCACSNSQMELGTTPETVPCLAFALSSRQRNSLYRRGTADPRLFGNNVPSGAGREKNWGCKRTCGVALRRGGAVLVGTIR